MTTEKTTTEARQGVTTHGSARRVLFRSLALAVVCLAVVIYLLTTR